MEGGTEEDVIAMEKQAELELADREEGEVDVKPKSSTQVKTPSTAAAPASPPSKKVHCDCSTQASSVVL